MFQDFVSQRLKVPKKFYVSGSETLPLTGFGARNFKHWMLGPSRQSSLVNKELIKDCQVPDTACLRRETRNPGHASRIRTSADFDSEDESVMLGPGLRFGYGGTLAQLLAGIWL